MIHIFFSVHLTIYRSAKSQPSSIRLELLICSISDLSSLEESLLSRSSSLYPTNIQRPVNLTACFGLTFRANLRNIQTKVHIVFFFFL